MINLAGDIPNVDEVISDELDTAGVDLIRYKPEDQRSEVKWGIVGRRGPFVFRRAWYYYVVFGGRVPLYIAEEMYRDEHGKAVRARGHCMAPPPHEQVEWFDSHGNELVVYPESDKKLIAKPGVLQDLYDETRATEMNRRIVTKEERGRIGKPYVTLYHIDTQEGLNLFVKTMETHGLV